jgi:RNA polymerase sigma-54 factor
LAIQQKLGLHTRLSQRLILTPSLQQAIKLLPLTTLELAEVLEQEVMENPLLEEVPVEETRSTEEVVAQEAAEERPDRDDPLKEIEVEKFFEDYFDDAGSFERRPRPSDLPEAPPLENTLTELPNLYDHMLWQLHMATSDELLMEIGDALIHNLDEDGLLRASLEEIANMGPYPLEEVKKTLLLVQSFDPAGVAARDLQECLRLQLRNLGLEGSPADVMVRDFMKQLQSHQYPEIGRQMNLSSEEVSHHLEIIKRLDPKPGMKHSPERSTYILPDVFVVKEGDE